MTQKKKPTRDPKIVETAQQQAEKSEYDLFKEQIVALVKPINDSAISEVIIGELASRISELEKLRSLEEKLAETFNCKKEEILELALELSTVYKFKEKAEDQLKKETEEFERERLKMVNELTQLRELHTTTSNQLEAEIERVDNLIDKDTRLSFWQKIFEK